jgi:hypothetical protein
LIILERDELAFTRLKTIKEEAVVAGSQYLIADMRCQPPYWPMLRLPTLDSFQGIVYFPTRCGVGLHTRCRVCLLGVVSAYAASSVNSARLKALRRQIVYISPYVTYFNDQSFWYLENIPNSYLKH